MCVMIWCVDRLSGSVMGEIIVRGCVVRVCIGRSVMRGYVVMICYEKECYEKECYERECYERGVVMHTFGPILGVPDVRC